MSLIKIDKGIPLPPQGSNQRTAKYPWRDMRVGDSIRVQGQGRAARSSAALFARKTGLRFAVRSFADHTRIWRIA